MFERDFCQFQTNLSQFSRYAPYPMAPGSQMANMQMPPTAQMTSAGSAAPQQAQQQINAQQAAAAANPYPGYNLANLANVDMSSFQNVDWASMYGMGMYV